MTIGPLRRALAATLVVAAVAAGCGDDSGDGAGGSDGGLRVVATTTQLGDLVRVVGGDAVEVTQLLAPNSDPHDYEPRPRDVQDTAGADVVLVSGQGLDAWMSEVVEQSGGDPEVVDVGASVPTKLEGEEHDDHGAEEEEHAGEEGTAVDPHWWHDPTNVRAAVGTIRDALVAADPGAREAVTRNADAYTAKLERLDAGIRACTEQVPRDERKIVTDHDAFGYFTSRYGIEVVGAVIPAQTTQAQASARDVAALADVIEREGVRAIFPAESVEPRLARALAAQTGASADHALYSDTLGPEGSPGATYLGMARANADQIVRGLTGDRRGCAIDGL